MQNIDGFWVAARQSVTGVICKAEKAHFADSRIAIQSLQHVLRSCATMMQTQPAALARSNLQRFGVTQAHMT